jgi:transcriptional regulator with XRE-family HTH domain
LSQQQKARKDKRKLILQHRGTLARMARRLRVSPSLLTRVLRGQAVSGRIDKAIEREAERLRRQTDERDSDGLQNSAA